MKKVIPGLVLIALSVFLFIRFGANQSELLSLSGSGEHYKEECQSEGCDVEEREELHESYESECFEESCKYEEVREIAGAQASINPMMDDFGSRGWTVSGCHRWGGCFYSPGDIVLTGDAFFGSLCTQSSINQHWDDFDFDQGDWDDGFGYDAACDINQPLARTFAALNLLDFFGTSMPEGGSNWLPWFYAYASDNTDELDAKCDFGLANGCTFATNYSGAGVDDRTELYWPFFYRAAVQNVPGRAATIVHESRHQGGKSHNCTTCPNGGSCDTNWGYRGAIYLEVMYLWWLRAQGTGVTSGLRSFARTRGNALLGNNFCNGNPTNQQVFGAGTANPNSLFSIP